MTTIESLPHAGQGLSVGSRLSWSAILGGAALALALNFLFIVLGSAVGLSIADRANPGTLLNGTIGWGLVTLAISLFAGGLLTPPFTIGENKGEGVVHGIIMWGVFVVVLMLLGGMGVRTGVSGLWASAHYGSDSQAWEALARQAGVPADQIDGWRKQSSSSQKSDQTTQTTQEASSRVAWYVFGGAWGSMIAAALGAWIGAGKVFRVVTPTGGVAIGQ